VSKFVHRHKRQMIAASLVLLALLGGTVGTTLRLLEARRQEEARKQEKIARDETVEKERARLAKAERVRERDAAPGEATYQLDGNRFLLASPPTTTAMSGWLASGWPVSKPNIVAENGT
jgi:hypothetical protein